MSVGGIRLGAACAAVLLLLSGCSSDGPKTGPGGPTSPSPSPTQSGFAWRACASAPSARQEVAAAAVGTKIFVAGGLGEDGSQRDVESYDTATDTWTSERQLPIALDHAMATAWRNRFVVLGGQDETGTPSAQVYAYQNGEWSPLPNLLQGRVAGGAVTVGDQIVVAGGFGPSGHIAETEVFDGTRWRAGPSLNEVRDHVAVATDGRSIFSAGGRRGSEQIAAAESTDLAARRSTKLADLPTPRSGLGGAFASGRLVTVGGEGPRIFPEVEAYDVAAKSWSRLPDLGVPRHGVGVVAIGSVVYAVHGGDIVGLGPTRACEKLDLASAPA